MACDRYFELLSARLDGALTQSEERELEEHMANCPECRTVGAQLAALQAGFAGLEEISAPEGFTQGVMDRIQKQKVIPWKPRFRALAGWAACLVLVAGLYGFTQNSREQDLTPMTRGVGLDTHMGTADGSGAGEDAPQIAAYASPEPSQDAIEDGSQKFLDLAPGPALYSIPPVEDMEVRLDTMPEGAEELISPETAVSSHPDGGFVYRGLSQEIIDQLRQMAVEQGIPVEVQPSEGEYVLVTREP